MSPHVVFKPGFCPSAALCYSPEISKMIIGKLQVILLIDTYLYSIHTYYT